MKQIQPYPVAVALSFIFLIYYFTCVVIHLLLADTTWEMYRWLEMILVQFTWLTPLSFILGIIEVIIGGFYIAYTLVPLYNFYDKYFSSTKGDETMKPLRFKPVAFTIISFGIITYTLCVISNLIFPQWGMYRLWEIFLPGFSWISWGSYFIGLIGLIGYGIYIAAIFVPVYNYFGKGKYPEFK